MKRAEKARNDALAAVQDRLGYVFASTGSLERALTHASLAQGAGPDSNYERLEFLGDRVLGLCIAEFLFARYADASEGELSVRLNRLVSAQTCAEVSDGLGLHEFIRTGADVKKLTGKRMINIRADVVEAVVAAIYLDGGLEAARAFILRHWEPRALESDADRRDAKTELQEWAHQKFGRTPQYRILDRSGPDHDPRFVVSVEIDGTASETGAARSKRLAEQEAATALLKREGVWS